MDWMFDNPWKKLDFNISFFLSKSGYVALSNELGVQANRFWLKNKSK